MNSLFKNIQINQLSGRLRQIAGTPNVLSMQFSAVDVAGIRESIITIANECKADDPQIARQLLAAKDILFAVNQFGQAFINPYAIGEILFGLDYLAAKGQAPSAEKQTTAEIWSYIHPLIQKSSKKLFEDGHFANAAEDAFIELNSRAKAIYKKLVPSAATVPDGTDLMHKLFGSNPLLCPVRDTGTESGNNYQQGFHFMTAGAMSALRNPKAHSNDEVSNVDGIAFKKEKAAGNGFLYTLSIPDKKYDRIEDKPFRRVDGNHRLLAIEKLIAEGQMRSNYLIPFCIIVFPDNVSMKDEKIIFHNINSKAVPIRSERLLEGIIVDSKDELSFSDKELDDSFGHEYLLARKVLKNKPLAIRKLKAIPWIRSDLITALIDIIESIQKRFGNIQTAEHEEAFGIALSNALNDAKLGENGTLLISSGLLFLLVALYYNIEISSPSADAVQYKDRLLTWSEKYQITDAQIDTEQNAASNAECIEAIFNRYVRSTEQTIFMSRCFSAEYNETENAIRRAINEINNEKKTGIMLIRVDEHHEGTTGQISDRIFRDIESAGLVIADLSSGKLNVPHEIGYAMGLKKDLILVHNGTSEEAEKHIPSNIRMFEQIRFNGDYQTLQNEIKRRLIDYYKL